VGGAEAPAFLRAHRAALLAAARRGPVLDVACGRGRGGLVLARAGARVVGLDRAADALGELRDAAAREGLDVSPVRCDLESGRGLPVRAASCGVVLVLRYLYRPLCAALAAALAPGGLLLYETFTRDQGKLPYGPRNPAFLLDPGELPGLFPGLRAEVFEEGRFADPRPFHLARLLARRPALAQSP
jgi:tellurite methyltransferase